MNSLTQNYNRIKLIYVLSIFLIFFLVSVVSAADDLNNESVVLGDVNETHDFNELSEEINHAGNELILEHDYEYVNGSNKGIEISKPITIDGAGHTLNGNHLSRVFNITSDDVTIKNINFINGNAFGQYFKKDVGGGAIYWSGNNGCLENCNFTNNAGSGIEDDPFDKEETIVAEDGSIIHIIKLRPMGAKINEGGAIVWNGTNGKVSKCIFTSNSVGYPNTGGAICWRGNGGTIVDSKFFDNDAWCGGAIAWIGDNGKILSSIVLHTSMFNGGIYWFGHNGNIQNSILLAFDKKSVLSPYDCNVTANYNFWGDIIGSPSDTEKIKNVDNWLVMSATHNGELVNKDQKITIKYEINKLMDKKSNLINYFNFTDEFDGEINYTATKMGYLKVSLLNGKVHVKIDSKDKISSEDLTRYYASKITYKVKVTDISDKVVGKNVIFKINGKKYTVKTNKKGIATLKLKLKPGKYVIYSSYGDAKVKNKIIIKKTLITKNLSKKFKKSARFKVKVLNNNGKSYSKQLVKIKFKGKTYRLKTNKKGIIFFKIPKNLKVGKYTIITTYNGLINSNKIMVKK